METKSTLVNGKQAHRKRKTSSAPAQESQRISSPVLQENQQQADMPVAFSAGQRPRRNRKKPARYEDADTPNQTRLAKAQKKAPAERSAEANLVHPGKLPRIPAVILSLRKNTTHEKSGRAHVAPSGESDGVVTPIAVSTQEEKGPKIPILVKNMKVVLRMNGTILTGGQREGCSSSKRPSRKSREKPDLKSKKPKTRHRKPHLKESLNSTPLSDNYNENEENGIKCPDRSAPKLEPLPSNSRNPFSAENIENDSGIEHQDPRRGECSILQKTAGKNVPPYTADEKEKQDFAGRTSFAADEISSENQQIETLMERISSMEEIIRNMHTRAGGGAEITAGRNSSGTRLKYSIESLIEASEEFATSREFESNRIARSMSQLWPDPAQDGNLAFEEARFMAHVRSAADSLVWEAFLSHLGSKSLESKKHC